MSKEKKSEADTPVESVKSEGLPDAAKSAGYKHRVLRVRGDVEGRVSINGRWHSRGQLVRGGPVSGDEEQYTEPASGFSDKEKRHLKLKGLL